MINRLANLLSISSLLNAQSASHTTLVTFTLSHTVIHWWQRLLIRSKLGFGILPKDKSTFSWGSLEFKPAASPQLNECTEWSSSEGYQVYSLVGVYSSGVSLISCTSVFLSLHGLSVLSNKQPVSQYLCLCCQEYSTQHSWQTLTASQCADDSSFMDTVADYSQSFLLLLSLWSILLGKIRLFA